MKLQHTALQEHVLSAFTSCAADTTTLLLVQHHLSLEVSDNLLT